jgi:hypothetical protein
MCVGTSLMPLSYNAGIGVKKYAGRLCSYIFNVMETGMGSRRAFFGGSSVCIAVRRLDRFGTRI